MTKNQFRLRRQKAKAKVAKAVTNALIEIDRRSKNLAESFADRQYISDVVSEIESLPALSMIDRTSRQAALSEVNHAAAMAIARAFGNRTPKVTFTYFNIY
jgi:hypothetical protein